MTGRLAGKTALITGSGSGIGEAMAVRFAQEGARVGVVDFDAGSGERVAAQITASGGEAFFVQTDVSDTKQVRHAVEAVLVRYGSLDALCNNAGIGFAAVCHETSEEDWERTMAINLRGVFLGCKHALPHMLRQGHGVICNTSSGAAEAAVPNRAAYIASKAGILGLTRSIAIDYADKGIRCNALLPGTVDSPWIGKILAQQADPAAQRRLMEARQPVGRLGRPDEIAAAALYLCSDEASFVTGAALAVDGGYLAR